MADLIDALTALRGLYNVACQEIAEGGVVIICIRCALEGFVKAEGQLAGHVNYLSAYGPVPDASVEEHVKRVHPIGLSPDEQRELEQRAQVLIKQQRPR